MGLLLLQGSAALNPRELFASGEQGLWLDPSDFSTMWQDSAKTTPVTAAGDPVGYISDKSGRGNDAFQTTSASRPTLARIPSSGRRNVLVRSEEFDNASWASVTAGATVTPNTTTGPFGGTVADTIAFTTTGYRYQVVNTGAAILGKTFTFSCWVASPSKATIAMRIANNGTGTDGANLSTNLTSTLTRVSVSRTFTGAGNTIDIGFENRTGALLGGDGIAGDVIVFGAQLEESASATSYQKVVATTDVTESGVSDLWHLVFDGSDDSLTTNSVDMTGTAQMTVIAGVRKLDTTARMIVELSTNATSSNGAFYFLSGQNATDGWWSQSKGDAGSSVNQATNISTSAAETAVVSSTHDISGDLTTIRRNGIAGTDATGDKGAGNFGNHVLYIGRRGGSSLPFNGHIYQLIIRGKTTPTGKLLDAERFVARKTGVSF